jgi:hypothetical protein
MRNAQINTNAQNWLLRHIQRELINLQRIQINTQRVLDTNLKSLSEIFQLEFSQTG